MDVEARNKYCGLLMFDNTPFQAPGLNEFIINNYDATSFTRADKQESYYSSQMLDSSSSIAAGAAAPGDDNSENGEKLYVCSKQQEKRPPRPPNAFILYRRNKQPAILAANRHLTNAEISRYIANLWKGESNETRLDWERYADRTKLEHAKAFPNYVYRPNKNKGKNERRRQKCKKADPVLSLSSPVETGPVKNKRNKGQNRVNPTSTPTSLQPMTPPPFDSSNGFWGMGYGSIQLTHANAQGLQDPLEAWNMLPAQYGIQHQESGFSQLSFDDLSVPSFREEFIDPSLIFNFNVPHFNQTVYVNNHPNTLKSTNNSVNISNTGAGCYQETVISDILTSLEGFDGFFGGNHLKSEF